VQSEDDEGPDRDTYCTPLAWARRLGRWDYDPCSNERSHIDARFRFDLSHGRDGLVLARYVPRTARTFINPPYSRGNVIRWVMAYRHTRFCFLVKFDPSTSWFEELYAATQTVCLPIHERVEFEPPPGVVASSNQFPHAFFFADRRDIPPAVAAACYVLDVDHKRGLAAP